MRLAVALSIALLIAGCVSSDKKEYPKLESIKPSANIQTLWVANVGEKGARHFRRRQRRSRSFPSGDLVEEPDRFLPHPPLLVAAEEAADHREFPGVTLEGPLQRLSRQLRRQVVLR